MSALPSSQSHLKAFGIGLVLALVALGGYLWFSPSASADLPEVTVYKSETCRCCSEWVAHMREQGFPVNVESRVNVRPVKKKVGVPSSLAACHTAVIGNYVVEGHVPASDVKRLLEEKPEVRGISVPGMPAGSPGMEQGGYVEPYEVLTFTPSGETSVFARYGRQ